MWHEQGEWLLGGYKDSRTNAPSKQCVYYDSLYMYSHTHHQQHHINKTVIYSNNLIVKYSFLLHYNELHSLLLRQKVSLDIFYWIQKKRNT